MLDLIIYIEIALVAIFMLGQKIYKDKDSSSNIATSIGLCILLTTVGFFAIS